jgi:D-alanine--poly(phosphoribitol) ligase subunit 1
MFLWSAARVPSNPALSVDGRFFSYAELAQRSDLLLARIRELVGVGGGNVALLLGGDLATYVGLLAILQARCPFVPLNAAEPALRLLDMLDNASCGLVVTGAVGRAVALEIRARRPSCHLLLVETDRIEHIGGDDPVGHGGDASPLAYIMHTSGTTGRPKGVPVSHAQAVSCVRKLADRFAVSDRDRFSNMFDLSFDPSIVDVFACWGAGACLFVPSRKERIYPVDFIERNALTVWGSVPSIGMNLERLGALRAGRFPSLGVSWFIGEALPKQVAQAWRSAAPNSGIFNVYGPTEATIAATLHEVAAQTFELDQVPIGDPLPGVAIVVVGPDEAPVDYGEPGELWLGGEQVVSGYWNDALATGAAFETRRFGEGEVQRWYRTGDIVSRSPAGLIFHGRADRQVKIAGRRVELQEIEFRLREVLGITAVAVIPVRDETRTCRSVVAFVEAMAEDDALFKSRCAERLPSYMIPSEFRSIVQFPLNRSGKIDYAALEQLNEKAIASRSRDSRGIY